MQQLRQPNYSVQGRAGWCLSVQQDVWGVPHLYTTPPNNTAHYAYDVAQFKHPGELPPAGIHALCYWTYRENGIDYWHVATRSTDGRVGSSPFDYAYGFQWFSSIDAMTARIRRIYPACQYVGWVEDLSNVRLVIGEDMNADNYTVQALAEGGLGRTASGDGNLQNNIGLPVNSVIDTFRNYPEWKARQAKANTYDADVKAAYERGLADAKTPADSVAKDTNEKVNWLVTMFQKIFK